MSRAVGSRNAVHSAVYCPSGGASSASKMARRVGVVESLHRVFIRGEGWVRWTEIEAQVARAFTIYRQRKALAGIYLFDGRDARLAQIAEAKAHARKDHA